MKKPTDFLYVAREDDLGAIAALAAFRQECIRNIGYNKPAIELLNKLFKTVKKGGRAQKNTVVIMTDRKKITPRVGRMVDVSSAPYWARNASVVLVISNETPNRKGLGQRIRQAALRAYRLQLRSQFQLTPGLENRKRVRTRTRRLEDFEDTIFDLPVDKHLEPSDNMVNVCQSPLNW